jgi:hypothetical protein
MNRDNARQFNVEPPMITRRQLVLGATAVAGGIAVLGVTGSNGTPAAASTSERVRLTLPGADRSVRGGNRPAAPGRPGPPGPLVDHTPPARTDGRRLVSSA